MKQFPDSSESPVANLAALPRRMKECAAKPLPLMLSAERQSTEAAGTEISNSAVLPTRSAIAAKYLPYRRDFPAQCASAQIFTRRGRAYTYSPPLALSISQQIPREKWNGL